MRKLRTAVLAGVAVLCVAGTAIAAKHDKHVLTINLPDGSVERIDYTGDVAPTVRIAPNASAALAGYVDRSDAAPFAMLDRFFEEMDQRSSAMMRDVQANPVASREAGSQVDPPSIGALPAGTMTYQSVSTSDGTHSCTQTRQVTSQGPNQKPKIISSSTGDCSVGTRSAGTATGSESSTTVRTGDQGATAKSDSNRTTI